MTPQPIATATPGPGWILGYVEQLAASGYVPWVPLTWSDNGWRDDNDNRYSPALWVPLPDPQPAPTGWMPPEGVIRIEEITGEGWKINDKPAEVPWRWSVYILRSDGEYDEYRELWHYVTYAEAEARASMWAQKLGLPIEVTFLDPKVTPLFPRGTVQ